MTSQTIVASEPDNLAKIGTGMAHGSTVLDHQQAAAAKLVELLNADLPSAHWHIDDISRERPQLIGHLWREIPNRPVTEDPQRDGRAMFECLKAWAALFEAPIRYRYPMPNGAVTAYVATTACGVYIEVWSTLPFDPRGSEVPEAEA